jgi:hypothetical protein
MIDITRFPVKVKFDIDSKFIEGNIYDISRFGICLLSEYSDKFNVGDSGDLTIWRVENNVVKVPGTLRWSKIIRKFCFYGVETDCNLYSTELAKYM